MHRIVRAVLQGRAEILAVRVGAPSPPEVVRFAGGVGANEGTAASQ